MCLISVIRLCIPAVLCLISRKYDRFDNRTLYSLQLSARWLNLAGDLEDLEMALADPATRPKHMKALWGGRPLGSGHCSALIKVLPDGEDLYTSQVTWSRYVACDRTTAGLKRP